MKVEKSLILALTIFTLSACSSNMKKEGAVTKQIDKNNYTKTEEFLENSKESEPELIAFLREMPKGGDLHNHVSGAYYTNDMINYVKENNLYYNVESKIFVQEPIDGNYENLLSYDEFMKAKLYEVLNLYSMRGVRNGNLNGHDHFFDTFGYMWSAQPSSDEMVNNIAIRNAYENMNYLELMVQSIPNKINTRYTNSMPVINNILGSGELNEKNMEKAYRYLVSLNEQSDSGFVTQELDTREKLWQNSLKERGENGKLTINYIQQLKRIAEPNAFFVDAYSSIYASTLDNRIVAVNMVQPEDHPLSRSSFPEEMKILNFLKRKFEKKGEEINFTLHAGELVLNDSPVESMQNRISNTLYLTTNKEDYDYDKSNLTAYDKPLTKRIGHGISIAWEEDFYDIIDMMRREKIAIEICLTSNEGILGVAYDEHPFILYKKYGVPMVISTDDEGVSRSNITNEYLKAVTRYNLNYSDLKNLVRNTIEYSFLEGDSLYINGNYNKVIDEFNKTKTLEEWKDIYTNNPLLDKNEKMKKEVQLEIEFLEFEKEIANI